MRERWAKWDDILAALHLEADTLGDDAAWSEQHCWDWWAAGCLVATVIEDDKGIVAYASALLITADAYRRITAGQMEPTNLALADRDPSGTHYWIGMILTRPERRRQGLGSAALAGLMDSLGAHGLADAYSPNGLALLRRLGWTQVNTAERPLFASPGRPL